MNLPAKSQLEWVVWVDAVGSSSRAPIEAMADVQLARNTNLGWVEHENEKRIVLAHGFSSTGEVDHLAIPKSCIVERRPVVALRSKKAPSEDN